MYNTQTDIAILSETWLKPETNIHFSGYKIVRKDSVQGHQGVAILIKNRIHNTEVTNSQDIPGIQCVSTKIHYNQKYLYIHAIYAKPGRNISTNDWLLFFRSLSKPYILGGDFNAHNTAFGSTWNDVGGNNLLTAFEECDLVFLNTGHETLLRQPYHNNRSAIDITVSTPDIAPAISDWFVHETTLGSDHFVITYSLVINNNNPHSITSTNSWSTRADINGVYQVYQNKWNTKKADWEKYSQSVDDYLSNRMYTLNDYNELLHVINQAGESAIPHKSVHINNKFRKEWWDQECQLVIDKQNESLRRYKRSPTSENFITYKRNVAITKKTINSKKKKCWREFCEKLNRSTPIKTIWQQIQKIKNVYQPPKIQMTGGFCVDSFLHKIAPPWAQPQIPFVEEHEEHELLGKFTS